MRKRLFGIVVVAGAIGAAAPGAAAQVVYEPVRYQYQTTTGTTYYYGGGDPAVHAHAAACRRGLTDYNRRDRDVPFVAKRDLIETAAPRVYVDCDPYASAAAHALSPDAARAAAYAAAPRHFTKRELLDRAVSIGNGVRVVAARDTAGSDASTTMATPPAGATTGPKPILIVPKRLMEEKLDDRKLVARAR